MSGREDTRLIDHLYGELSEQDAREYQRALEEDPALAAEAESFESTLGLMREHEDEEPSPHLDALILAHARQEAEKLEERGQGVRGFLRKMFRSPSLGVVVAGSLAAVIAVAILPSMYLMRSASAPESLMVRDIPVVAQSAEESSGRAERSVAARRAIVEQQAPKGAEREEPPPPPAEMPVLARRDREPVKQEPAAKETAKREVADEAPPATLAAKARPAKKAAIAPANEKPTLGAPKTAAGVESDESGRSSRPADLGNAGASMGDGVAEKKKDSTRTTDAPKAEEAERAPALDDDSASFATKAPAQTTAPAGGLAGPTPFDAAAYARDVLRAAEAQLAQKDSVGARRILINGMQRTVNTPAHGELALRVAQLDYAEGRYEDAARYARIAAVVPGFAKQAQAQALAKQALSSSNETRAKRAAPTAPVKADEAAPSAAEDAR